MIGSKKVRKCLKAGGLDEPNSEQLAVETSPSIVTNIVDYIDEKKWDRRTPELDALGANEKEREETKRLSSMTPHAANGTPGCSSTRSGSAE